MGILSTHRAPSRTYTTPRVRVKCGVFNTRATRCFAIVLCALIGICAAAPAWGKSRTVYVNRIEIGGNHNISTAELKKQMRTREPSFLSILRRPRFSRAYLDRDLAHLEAFYHTAGYSDATVSLERLEYNADRRFVDIYIKVVEGAPTRIESLTFSKGSLLSDHDLRKGLLLTEGRPYNASLLATDIYTIKTKYFRRGYLAVAIRDSVQVQGRAVHIGFDIEPGTRIRIRNVEITGNERVRTSVIAKEFTFHSGDVCTLDKLTESRQNLFETGLFTVVDISPVNLDPLERTVDLRVRVRERKPSYVEAGFGVGNIVGSRLTGEWGTRNLFGTGRTLRARTEYSYDIFAGERIDFSKLQFENIYYRYDLVFQQRRLFGTKLILGLDTFLERDATVANISIRTVGGSISAFRRIHERTEIRTGLSLEDIRRAAFGAPEVNSSSHILSSSISRDQRDFVLNPHRGWYRTVRTEVGGGALGGRNDFYTVSFTLQQYEPLGRSTTLAWRARVGYGNSFGRSLSVPIENRYFLGGSNSVRGYNENALGPQERDESGRIVTTGGEFLLLGNLELRVPLPLLSRWKFSGALFLDSGNVWSGISAVSARDFRVTANRANVTVNDYRYSVGLGIRYNTPVGPVRFDYGLPIKRDNLTADGGRFHVTLGQIF